ncbi:MAG: Ku protein [Pseudonocardiaceae bacterium]|nr:Ku protein [Pseudonocardiaceae bacterium]
MRPVWKGSVAFGMVTIPVRLYSATQEHDIRFHQVHNADGGRIRYKRFCEVCGLEVAYDDIDRAVEQPDGTVVTVSRDELGELAVATGHEIDVVEFVPVEQIDPVLYNRSYYVEPESRSLKPYVLLRQALYETDRIAICRVTLRQRESLAALRVRGDVIIVQTLLWPDEVREPSFEVLSGDVELRSQERQMAKSLVDSLTEDFDPAAFTDRYAEAVADLVATKAAEGGSVAPKAPEPAASETGKVTDLVEALRASVEQAKSERSGSGSGSGSAKRSRSTRTTKSSPKSSSKPAPTPSSSSGSSRKKPASDRNGPSA